MRSFIALILFTFLLPSTGNSQPWQFSAKVELLPDQTIYLASLRGEEVTITDSAASLQGRFRFSLDNHYKTGVYRVLLGNGAKTDAFGRTTESFDFLFDHENISVMTSNHNLVDSMQVLQSEENRIYYTFLRTRERYVARIRTLLPLLNLYTATDPFYAALSEELVRVQQELTDTLIVMAQKKPGSFVSRFIRVFQEPVYKPTQGETMANFMREHYFDLVDLNDSTLLNSQVYTQKVITYLSFFREASAGREQQEKLFMKAIDGIMNEVKYNQEVYEFVINYLIDGFQKISMENVLVYIADNYVAGECETDNVKIMDERLEAFKRMAVGQRVDNIVLPDMNDHPQRLSSLSNRYVLVLFWASWCPHCQGLLPRIRNWYENNSSASELGIYAVSIDTSRAGWEEYVMENRLPWTNVYEIKGWEGKVARQFNIYATPTMFLLDRDRKIIAKPLTFRDFKKKMEDLAM